jgi:hypothetical protein
MKQTTMSADNVQNTVLVQVMPSIRPIVFSTPMVKAILSGHKKQTRRIVKPPFAGWITDENLKTEWANALKEKCPYGMAGDILWVRETWQYVEFGREPEEQGYVYKASNNGKDWQDNDTEWKWKPSIFMPKAACRLFLKITGIRVERLQDISDEDAAAEGVSIHPSARMAFASLWDKINGKNNWNSNPFVWVISFESTNRPKGFR